ncbi:hypothetical protein FRB99_005221 [Tulasnella sp. 403]|nr:hypothetical protein FRB99_005221 [Tulasnella sp. 403]
MKALEEGTQKLEEGTPSALFNYGVTCYHLKDFSGAIDAWKESIELQPDSPDAHTNLASAYIMMPLSRPDLALQHLRQSREAARLAPEDAEIAFNLAAVLEAGSKVLILIIAVAGHLEEALEQYKRSKEHGVEKAAMHMRNVSAKILGKKLKEAAEEEAASAKK